jgi:hypothetical protein
MADGSPQAQNPFGQNAAAAPLAEDYYSVLVKVIEAVSQDPAQLRRLIYAMAWHNLKPDLLLARSLPNEVGQARSILELERTLEFKRAVERVEAEIATRANTHRVRDGVSQSEHAAARLPGDRASPPGAIYERERAKERGRGLESLASSAGQPLQERVDAPPPSSVPTWRPLVEDLNPFRDGWNSTAQSPRASGQPEKTLAADAEALPRPVARGADPRSQSPPENSESPAPIARQDADIPSSSQSSNNAVIILPDAPPAWLQRSGTTLPDRVPLWHDRPIRVAVEMVGHAPTQPSPWLKPGLLSFVQLVAAAVLAVALYVGISDWLNSARQGASVSTPMAVPPTQPAPAAVAVGLGVTPIAGEGPSAMLRQPEQREPQAALPFPLPKTYGVYVASNGQLTELTTLPIKIPDSRINLSAEIRTPSQAILPSGKLAFVVFRRDLLNHAPQTVSLRVVARVARAMRFVDGKPLVIPVEGAWRIRNKGYEFKVSPVEGQREMIVIQPDPGFVLPAGRYALVLNGYGYDFTVPGAVTSAEHCLEQAVMLNGTVLSECAKS